MQSRWYYRDERYNFGPLTWEQLQANARVGRLKPSHVVRQDDGNWVRAESVSELFSQSAEKPSTPSETPSSPLAEVSSTPDEPSTRAENPVEIAPTLDWDITSGGSSSGRTVADDAEAEVTGADDSASSKASSDHFGLFEEPGSSGSSGSSGAGATRIVRKLAPGSLLGNYEILETLGEGGMGTVLKARHVRMDRLVALKILRTQSTKPAGAIKRFQQEVKAASRLTHPNIVTAHDADEVNGVHFLVMEYVEGHDLDELLKERGGTLPFAEAVGYVLQVAKGLAFAHSERVIHRDIKPGNLMLDKRGTIKILDMGLASVKETTTAQARHQESVHLTEADQILGTFDYMAPEQGEDARSADHRADIYSLGCTLFKLVTGKTPYRGKTTIQKIFAHREHPIPTMSKLCPDVPFDLDAVFGKMVAKDPGMRYQSMEEVIADLEACLHSKPISAWQTGRWGQSTAGDSQSHLSDEKLRIEPPSSDEDNDADEYTLSPLGGESQHKQHESKQQRDTEEMEKQETKQVEPRWFWRVMGEEIGPLTFDELRAQNVNGWDEVRRENSEQWMVAQDVEGLFK